MTENMRNITVGVTVLIGLAMLAALMIAFAGLPEFFQTGNTIRIRFAITHDIEPGDSIHLCGKKVGVVRSVEFTDGDPRKGITITGRIFSDVRLPRNVQAKVFTKGLVGKGYLSLIPDGPMPKGAVDEFYGSHEEIDLTGVHDTGAGLLPPELTKAFEDFGKLAKNLNERVVPKTLDTMDALKKFLTTGEKTFTGADELIRKLLTVADAMGDLLVSLRQTVDKFNTGEGTAGKLLNDPKLYDNLVQVAEQMDGLVKDFRRLVDKWDRQGMGVRLK